MASVRIGEKHISFPHSFAWHRCSKNPLLHFAMSEDRMHEAWHQMRNKKVSEVSTLDLFNTYIITLGI
jgi:hypothetical protein